MSPRILTVIADVFRVPTHDADLVMAQYRALIQQIPLLYLILTVNSLAVAFTYARLAPLWLAVGLPGLLSVFCLARAWVAWKKRHLDVQFPSALKQLQLTNKLGPLLAVAFTTWSLSLYPYGDPYAQGQVAFYMGLTVIGCIFCLMHLRSAALSVTLIVNVPFVIFLYQTPHVAMSAIAINLALVCVAMSLILFVYYRDFVRLVTSQRSLLTNQARTQVLSDENLRLAHLDSLTNLPNRRSFFRTLDTVARASIAAEQSFAVGIIDLDGFKPVNDTYGHGAGDFVLAEVAERLRAVVTESHAAADLVIARLGGDEFGLIVSAACEPQDLTHLGKTIIDTLKSPIQHISGESRIGATLGFAIGAEGQSAKALYERADFALYQAKRTRRGQTLVFDCGLEEKMRSQGQIEHALKNADLNNELHLVFQPVIDLRSNRILAFEALARWTNPILGAVSPAVFIPAAERCGMIRALTGILLTKALHEARNWPDTIQISFNLSAQDLSIADGLQQIVDIVRESGIDPRRIDFEITETSVSLDMAMSLQTIGALKQLGASIALDDFGTGYSSLSHLHQLPLNKIKIDRSFVADIVSNPASFKIVKSMSALCRDMDVLCVVEGVETEEQYAVLRRLKCHVIQGYLLSKPVAPGELPTLLERYPGARFATKARSQAA